MTECPVSRKLMFSGEDFVLFCFVFKKFLPTQPSTFLIVSQCKHHISGPLDGAMKQPL